MILCSQREVNNISVARKRERNKKEKRKKIMNEKLRNNMDVIIGSIIFTAGIVTSVMLDIPLVMPMVLGYICYAGVAVKRGSTAREIGRMSMTGAKESMVIIATLLIIGMVSAAWRASGTIAMFVSYGLEFITPPLFLLLAFLICCLFSYALGSCFGVAGTIGIILVSIAKAGDVSVLMTAGAVLSGGYFGDRCSPVSASASLTAFVTKTDLYKNVKLMAKTMAVPMIITCIMYAALSLTHPLKQVDSGMPVLMEKGFNLSPVLLLPVAVMMILPLFKVNIKVTAVISVALSFAMAVFLQGMEPAAFLKSLALGYETDNERLAAIFAGGGMVSMANISGVILLSCAYAQIIKEKGLFEDLIHMMSSGCRRIGRVYMTFITGTFFSGLFCSGSAAIIMSSMLLGEAYEETGGDKQELAIDIENTAELTATWVPWSAACMAAFSVMNTPAVSLVFAFFVFVLPVYHMLTKTFVRRKPVWYHSKARAAV